MTRISDIDRAIGELEGLKTLVDYDSSAYKALDMAVMALEEKEIRLEMEADQ